jgi:calcineurin-like phosphoesterase family protein
MSIFLTADTHFSHQGVCNFLAPDGISKLRPWDNAEEMDEVLVERWNKVVGPKDKVYHLGDVVINRRGFKVLERLNGIKILIKGNHDTFRIEEYLEYFKDVKAYDKKGDYVLSHVPMHPDCLTRFKRNIHGHLHACNVLQNNELDKRYVCVSVEQTNFAPIAWEDAIKRFE